MSEQVIGFLPVALFLVILYVFLRFQLRRQKPIVDENFHLLRERNELLKQINTNLSEISEHLNDLKKKGE